MAAALAFALAVLALAGCPFDPRDPPAPAAPTPCDSTLSQNNPNDIRRKIVRGFECVRPSIYAECLGPGFLYFPDVAANNAAPPGFFATWSQAREIANIDQALVGADPATEVRMRILRFVNTGELSGDQARFDVQYELRTVRASGDTLFYGACATWDFIGVQTFPVFLHRWTDRFAFGSGDCTPDETAEGTESSGFLRIRSGVF